MIEDELPDPKIAKAAIIICDQIYNGEDGALSSSKFVDLIETLVEIFHGEDMSGHLHKIDPNKSGSFDRFFIVRWYVDKEVSLESTEDAERFVDWVCKVGLVYLKQEIF